MQVQESSAEDVSRLVFASPRLDAIAAAFAETEKDGRLKDADVVVRQMVRQPIGRNEELRTRESHDQLQPVQTCLEIVPSPSSIRATLRACNLLLLEQEGPSHPKRSFIQRFALASGQLQARQWSRDQASKVRQQETADVIARAIIAESGGEQGPQIDGGYRLYLGGTSVCCRVLSKFTTTRAPRPARASVVGEQARTGGAKLLSSRSSGRTEG